MSTETPKGMIESAGDLADRATIRSNVQQLGKKKTTAEIIACIPPAVLARLRGTRQDTSTRDKKRLVEKAKEVEDVVKKILKNA